MNMRHFAMVLFGFSVLQGFDADTASDEILSLAKEYFPDYDITKTIISINVCAHCGPGTVGVLIVPRINEHSLNYYLDM